MARKKFVIEIEGSNLSDMTVAEVREAVDYHLQEFGFPEGCTVAGVSEMPDRDLAIIKWTVSSAIEADRGDRPEDLTAEELEALEARLA